MPQIKLTQPAVILGVFYPAGTEIECHEDTVEEGYKQHRREKARQRIESYTGRDAPSLIGVTNDAVNVAAYCLSSMLNAISESSSIDELKEKVEKLRPIVGSFANKVDAGVIALPFATKAGGIESVLEELAATANGTTSALSLTSNA